MKSLERIATAMIANARLNHYHPGTSRLKSYRRTLGELLIENYFHDPTQTWVLEIMCVDAAPNEAKVKECRAAFEVPEYAIEKQFKRDDVSVIKFMWQSPYVGKDHRLEATMDEIQHL